MIAQDSIRKKSHYATFKSQFFQIKDEFNYGLVFSGLNLVFEYTFILDLKKNTFQYTPAFAFGVDYNKGIGLAWTFKPVDVFYGFRINSNDTKPLTIGPYISTNYFWQLYPELQSGHMFWFSSIEIGPRIIWKLPYKGRSIFFKLSNSIAGWTSRPTPSTETHYYSLTIGDFISNAHSNMEFGSFNLFNHTDFQVEILNPKRKRLSMAYEFEYFGYFQEPRLNYIVHSFNLKWKVGKIQ